MSLHRLFRSVTRAARAVGRVGGGADTGGGGGGGATGPPEFADAARAAEAMARSMTEVALSMSARFQASNESLKHLEASLGPIVEELHSYNSALKVGSEEWRMAIAAEKQLTAARKTAAEDQNKARDAASKAEDASSLAAVQKAAADYQGEKGKRAPAAEGGGMADMVATASAVAGAGVAIVTAGQQIFDTMKSFVEALSPATVAIFTMEIKNLQATVGQAFLPVIQVATQAVRDFADKLSPIMQQLAPVMGKLAEQVASALMPVIDAALQIFRSLMPVLQIVVDLMPAIAAAIQATVAGLMLAIAPLLIGLQVLSSIVKALNPVLEIFQAAQEGMALIMDTAQRIFTVLIETIVQFISSFLPFMGLGDAAKNLKDMFRLMAEAMLRLVAHIAKLFNAGNFLESLQKNLRHQDEAGVRAQAAGPTSIKGLDAVVKDLATASAMAQGKGGGESEADRARKEEAEWRNRMADEVGKIAGQGMDWEQFKTWLSEQVPHMIRTGWNLIQDAAKGLKDAAVDQAEQAKAGVEDAFKPIEEIQPVFPR